MSSNDELVIIVIVLVILSVFFLCVCAFACDNQPTPAYSAPIVITSQSHQPPGSSQRISIINENSGPSGFYPRSSSPAAGMPMPPLKQGFTIPGSHVNSNAPYPPMNAVGSHQLPNPYAPLVPYSEQVRHSNQDLSNITQRSNTPQPSAPSFSPDMDVPPNYDEAMTKFSKEQKKL